MVDPKRLKHGQLDDVLRTCELGRISGALVLTMFPLWVPMI